MRSRSRSPERDPALADAAARLPAAQHREELLRLLARRRVVVCVGETGSGKTTQLPQFLLANGAPGGNARVAVTQPRRVAAVAAAQRVAREVGTRVGRLVGYAIRFDERSSDRTRVKFLTDGVLVRECLSDPLLSRYDCVVLDEAHERSLHTDVLLGLLKQLLARRPRDFHVIIASATLDHARFAAFFSIPDVDVDVDAAGSADATDDTSASPPLVPCPVVQIPGRAYPVDIFHSKTLQVMGRKGPLSTYVRAAVETTLQVHNSESEGHILVFLTGQQEIDDACRQIRELHRQQRRDGTAAVGMELRVLPLYGALQSTAQRAIFDPVPTASVRKVVVATNIAETSLTIDGVRFVVDCGFTKQKVYNPAQQMESLVVVPVSKVSAQQRAGRAGRTGPGKCFRLYSKASYAQMMDETIPEIRRANLANTVLYMKLLGIYDVLGFPYFDPPDEDAILDALKQLFELGALDERGDITPLGKLMSAFPLEPKLSRALIEAVALDCERDMVKIVAMLSAESIFEQKSARSHSSNRRRRGGDESNDDDDDDDDDGAKEQTWESLMLQLKSEGMLSAYGDHLSFLEIFRGFESARDKEAWCRDRRLRLRALQMAASIWKQIQDIVDTLSRRDVDGLKARAAEATTPASASRSSREMSRSSRLRKAGFFMNAARRCTMQTVYRLLHRDEGSDVKLAHFHPQSALNYVAPPAHCVYHELVVTSKPFMRSLVEVESEWLDEYRHGKESISVDALYALCGRATPPSRQPEASRDESARASASAPASTKQRVNADAVSAARARFLARKKARGDVA